MPKKYKPKTPSETHCQNCGNKFMTTRKAKFCSKAECQAARKAKNLSDWIERKYQQAHGINGLN